MNSHLPLFFVCLLAFHAKGQQAPTEAPKKPSGLIDAAKRLLENKDSVSDETKKKAADAAKAALNQVPEDLQKKAKDMLSDPKAAAARSRALEAIRSTTQKPAETAAQPARTATGAASPGPQPRRLTPLTLDAAKPARAAQTVVTATKTAYFDNAKGEGLYTGNVRVRSPQGSIDCEELEIHMPKQPAGKDKKKPSAADSDILASGPGSSPLGVRPEIAYARGSMVTIKKFTDEGELQVANCNEVAIYDGKTGKITLRGWPSVQQGGKLIEATDPRTYMILDEKGKLSVEGGPQRTTLVGENSSNETPPASPEPAETPGSQQR